MPTEEGLGEGPAEYESSLSCDETQEDVLSVVANILLKLAELQDGEASNPAMRGGLSPSSSYHQGTTVEVSWKGAT
jgi:hypothetical protein